VRSILNEVHKSYLLNFLWCVMLQQLHTHKRTHARYRYVHVLLGLPFLRVCTCEKPTQSKICKYTNI
jgi:hypothetical protein